MNVQRWHFKTNFQKDMSSIWKGIIKNSIDDVVSKCVGVDSFHWKIGNEKSTLF